MAQQPPRTPDDKHETLQPLHPSMAGKLDPAFEKLYNDNVANTPLQAPDLAMLRQIYSRMYSYGKGPAPEVGKVCDASFALQSGDGSGSHIPLRIYQPATEGPWPVHVNFHGGGWGLGDLESEAHICRHVCVKANVVVIDVAYRLVPEHPFPTAVKDAWAAVRHITQHGAEEYGMRGDSVSIGGVSAGATIALILAHLARDSSPPVPLSLVAVGTPTIDDLSQYSSPSESPWPSMQENQFAPTLNWARLKWFDKLKQSFLNVDESNGWYLNLMQAPDFGRLAKTVVYTASADPMRDEGEAYARALAEAGVEVTLRRFPGVPHPFMHMNKDLWQAREYIDRMAREIRLAHWEA